MWDFDGGGDKLVAGNKMVTKHSGTQGLPCRGIVDGFASTVQILAEWSPFQCSNLFLPAGGFRRVWDQSYKTRKNLKCNLKIPLFSALAVVLSF